MAKKNERENQRRAIAEQLRKEQQRKERQRSLLILGVCIAIVVGLLGVAGYSYDKDKHEKPKAAGTPLAELGVKRERGWLRPGQERGRHRLGPAHQPAEEDPLRRGAAGVRPALAQLPAGFGDPQLLHRERPSRDRATGAQPRARPHDPLVRRDGEAGHPGLQGRPGDLRRSSTAEADKFMAAPWNEDDGGSFPSGKHIASRTGPGRTTRRATRSTAPPPAAPCSNTFMKAYPAEQRPGARRTLIAVRSGRCGRDAGARRRPPSRPGPSGTT